MESAPGQEDVNVAVKVTFWPATELVGVTEIEVPLAWAVVTEPTATKARARINFLIANADYVPADPKSGCLRYLDPSRLTVRLGPFGGLRWSSSPLPSRWGPSSPWASIPLALRGADRNVGRACAPNSVCVQRPASVQHDLEALEPGPIKVAELAVPRLDDDSVYVFAGHHPGVARDLRLEAAELDRLEQRVDDGDLSPAAVQELDDREHGRERQLLHVLPVRCAQDEDVLSLEAAEQPLQAADPHLRHAIVGLPALTDQAELAVGSVAEQEPRVDGDAVAPDAQARAMQVREGL